MGVSTSDGQTALTRTPRGASSRARARVRLDTAPLLAQYTAAPVLPCSPASLERFTMQPDVVIRCGTAATVVKKSPLRFTLRQRSKAASSVNSTGPSVHTPAEL